MVRVVMKEQVRLGEWNEKRFEEVDEMKKESYKIKAND